MRDSRWAFLVVAGLLGGLMLYLGAAIPRVFPTQEDRDELVRLATGLGNVAQGMAGKPVNVGSMGGYAQSKYGPVFTWIAAVWSILALSSTLAEEGRAGSLDFVVTSPVGRRRIALEKLVAHTTTMVLAVVVLAFAAWLAGEAFGRLPGDGIAPEAAAGFGLWIALMALASGGVAFALAPFLGRAASAGIAGFALGAGLVLNGYREPVPSFQGFANLTPWAWTADHLPLANQYDWGALAPVALVVVVLFAIGVEALARRDVGVSTAFRLRRLPAPAPGLRGPVGRSFAERLPVALAWAAGLGVFGLVMAAASRSFADQMAESPDIEKVFRNIFPAVDMSTAGGFLQLTFVQLGFIVAGFAAVTLVSGWGSDETSGRLEMLLATPPTRGAWAVLGGIGVWAAVVVMTVVLAVAVGIGAAVAGSGLAEPMGMPKHIELAERARERLV